MVKRWDAELAVSTVVFSDADGFNGTVETRACLAEPVPCLKVHAGAGGLFQYTDDSRHTMTDLFGLALGEFDWFYPRNDRTGAETARPAGPQRALGGGYASDVNSNDQKEGSAGFPVQPAVGPITASANRMPTCCSATS